LQINIPFAFSLNGKSILLQFKKPIYYSIMQKYLNFNILSAIMVNYCANCQNMQRAFYYDIKKAPTAIAADAFYHE
jgi:hypothetical protein